jgi:hypothetical protein
VRYENFKTQYIDKVLNRLILFGMDDSEQQIFDNIRDSYHNKNCSEIVLNTILTTFDTIFKEFINERLPKNEN